MNAPVNPQELALQTVEFKLDGKTILAYEGETILKAAKRHGIDIPHLCFKDGYRPDGNCRACVVEINGERTLAPSCCRSATAGMEVKANSERALKSQKLVLEMLLSDMPDEGYKWVGDSDAERERQQHGELSEWANRLDVAVRPELKALRRHQPQADLSHPAMAVNLDACIQCNRCVRACREEQVNDPRVGVAEPHGGDQRERAEQHEPEQHVDGQNQRRGIEEGRRRDPGDRAGDRARRARARTRRAPGTRLGAVAGPAGHRRLDRAVCGDAGARLAGCVPGVRPDPD